jgi:site-specific DNA-methyltransferase (adenine-specific)
MKPVKLFDYQIQNNTKCEDVVLDTFAGSGTTLIACEQNGRVAYCCELDPKYCDVIIDRWEALTGQKAVLVG